MKNWAKEGVDWEGALITIEMDRARSRTVKFVSVFLSAAVEDCIPEPLRGGTHYALTSEDACQRLYDSCWNKRAWSRSRSVRSRRSLVAKAAC